MRVTKMAIPQYERLGGQAPDLLEQRFYRSDRPGGM